MSFVKNAWYLAAWDYEVGDQPLGRVNAEQPVVILGPGGVVVAGRLRRYAALLPGTWFF